MNDYNTRFDDIKQIITDASIDNPQSDAFNIIAEIMSVYFTLTLLMFFPTYLLFSNSNQNIFLQFMFIVVVMTILYTILRRVKRDENNILFEYGYIILSLIFLTVDPIIVYLKKISFYIFLVFYFFLLVELYKSGNVEFIHNIFLIVLIFTSVICYINFEKKKEIDGLGVLFAFLCMYMISAHENILSDINLSYIVSISFTIAIPYIFNKYKIKKRDNVLIISKAAYEKCLVKDYTETEIDSLIQQLVEKIDKKENLVKWIMTSAFLFIGIIITIVSTFFFDLILIEFGKEYTLTNILSDVNNREIFNNVLIMIFIIMILIFLYILFFIKLTTCKDNYILQYLYNIKKLYFVNEPMLYKVSKRKRRI